MTLTLMMYVRTYVRTHVRCSHDNERAHYSANERRRQRAGTLLLWRVLRFSGQTISAWSVGRSVGRVSVYLIWHIMSELAAVVTIASKPWTHCCCRHRSWCSSAASSSSSCSSSCQCRHHLHRHRHRHRWRWTTLVAATSAVSWLYCRCSDGVPCWFFAALMNEWGVGWRARPAAYNVGIASRCTCLAHSQLKQ